MKVQLEEVQTARDREFTILLNKQDELINVHRERDKLEIQNRQAVDSLNQAKILFD